MELPKNIEVSDAESDTDVLLKKMASGQAILFVGSGFAAGAKNLLGDEMLPAAALANQIATLGGFDLDDDLRYVTDRFIKNNGPQALVDYLLKAFTVSEVLDHHRQIVSAKWRRTYTTNYDLVVERAASDIGVLIETIDIDEPPATHLAKSNICVHLNGSIRSLDADALNSTFKLSSSSYVSPESFVSSRWSYPFRRDIERASAVVFVGYSLYDIEIQRVLFDNSTLREKTYFILRGDASEKLRFTVSQFGTPIAIGAEGFGKLIAEKLPAFEESVAPVFITAFEKYRGEPTDQEIRDGLIEKFVVHGDMANEFIDKAVRGIQEAPYLVRRAIEDKVIDFVKRGKSVVLTSNFGNGKSILGRVVRSRLAAAGEDIYELVDIDDDYISDAEKLISAGGRKIIFVDDYDRCFDLIEYCANFGQGRITFLLCARSSNHEKLKSSLQKFNFDYAEVGADELTEEEAGGLVDLLDNIGLWGESAAETREKKIARVMYDCRSHIASVLLEVFESPQMKDRITALIRPLLDDLEVRKTIFAICILEVSGLPLNSSLISRVAGSDVIFQPALHMDGNFRSLYNVQSGRIVSRSSVFALVLIRNFFPASYTVDRMLDFVSSVGDERGEAREIQLLFKQLMRFTNVERVLPERNRKDNLVRYYETVKRNLEWQAREPHYWVQYAMALLTFSDFTRAQTLLDTAYALAEKRVSYHTNNIDTQQARLFFMRSLHEADGVTASKLFSEGHKVLSRVPDDVGKFRQVERYTQIYAEKYASFPAAGRVDFEHASKNVLRSVRGAAKSGLLTHSAQYLAEAVDLSLSKVVEAIVASRPSKK